MVDGMLAMIPSAKVGHIGLYRDPVTALSMSTNTVNYLKIVTRETYS